MKGAMKSNPNNIETSRFHVAYATWNRDVGTFLDGRQKLPKGVGWLSES
jgi:hypothetical protein